MSGDHDLDFVSVGGAMVDRYYRLSNLPSVDGGAYVRDAWLDYGGVGANVACAAARLGRDVGLVARLGTDEDGGTDWAERLRADLADRGVDAARVRRGEETGTFSTVLLGPDGDRMVFTGGESAAALSLREDDWPYLRSASAIALGAYVPDRVVAPLIEARADGELPPVAFDLSGPLPELEGRGVTPATIDRAVDAADLFVAGEVALDSYCEHRGIGAGAAPDDAVVAELRDLGVRRAALTHGEAGATLVTPERTVEVAAYDVDVVDTTGAGDAFVAALVDAWLLEGRPPAEAGRFAAAVAALNCTAEGARGNLLERPAVEQFRRERG